MSTFLRIKPPKKLTLPRVTKRPRPKDDKESSGTPVPTPSKKKGAPRKPRAAPKKARAAPKARGTKKAKKVPPPEEEYLGEVYANLYQGGANHPIHPRARLSLQSHAPPPMDSNIAYKLAWPVDDPLVIADKDSEAVLRVAYKLVRDSKSSLKEVFKLPIRWAGYDPETDLHQLDDGKGGFDFFWFLTSCCIQWTDSVASGVLAIYFAVTNHNFKTDWGEPIWLPRLNMGDWLNSKFEGRYVPLKNVHPDPDVAVATVPPAEIPQKTPAWIKLRTHGGTAVANMFKFYDDDRDERGKWPPNAAMLRGSQGEDEISIRWLSEAPHIVLWEIGWTPHPTKGDRGDSSDVLVRSLEPVGGVPVDALDAAKQAGEDISKISWEDGTGEFKLSEFSPNMVASYIPQYYNHMICNKKWVNYQLKACDQKGIIHGWRIFRNAKISAELEYLCSQPGAWTGLSTPDTAERLAALKQWFIEEADRMNKAGPDFICRYANSASIINEYRQAQRRWYLDGDATVPRGLVGENAKSSKLADAWMNGVDVQKSIDHLHDLMDSAHDTLYPYPGKQEPPPQEFAHHLQEHALGLRRIIANLESSLRYIEGMTM